MKGQSRNPKQSESGCKSEPAALCVLNALLFAALCFFWSGTAIAQQGQPAEPAQPGAAPQPQTPAEATEPTAPAQPEAKSEKAKNKEKRGAIVAAPLPIPSPALGSGTIPVVGYIFPFSKNDKVSPLRWLAV
jgi:hypothetical protein